MKTTRREALLGLLGAVTSAFVVKEVVAKPVPKADPVSWYMWQEEGTAYVNANLLIKGHICKPECSPNGKYDPYACSIQQIMEGEDKVFLEFAAKAVKEWEDTHV